MTSPSPSDRQPRSDAATGQLLDFGPLLVFFVAYRLRDIYWATGAFMVAAPLALLLAWRRERRLRPLPLVTTLVVLTFGAMTIWLHDPRFIYVKPTLVAGITGIVLLGGLLVGRPLMRPLLSASLTMADRGWRILSLRFALFSLFLAAANELVWRSFTPHSEGTWVWFKLLGIPGLTVVFLLAQAPLLERYRDRADAAGDEP